MTNEPENVEPPSVEPPSVEQQRAELAATVEALAAKVDVPTRVKGPATEQAQHLKDAAVQQSRNLKERPEIIAAVVGFVVAAVVVFGIRRRRSRR